MIKILIISLFFLFFIILMIINQLYKRTKHYKNYVGIWHDIKKAPNGLKIVSFGSTYAKYALDFSKTEYAFNFAVIPQYLAYNYKMLLQFKANLAYDCIVLIVLPDMIFTTDGMQRDSKKMIYYNILKKENIYNFQFFYYIKSKVIYHFPVLQKGNWRYIIRDTGYFFDMDENEYEDSNGVMKHAIERTKSWEKQLKVDLNGNVSIDMKSNFKNCIRLVQQMVDYCIDNDFQPIILVPPVTKERMIAVGQELYKKYLINNIRKANIRNIPILNYLDNEHFQDFHLYTNSDCLNATGRKMFTKQVLLDLKELGYL